MADITHLFEPRSVAVIGASRNKNKIGHTVVRNILESGYTGALYPVNPSGGEILGLPTFKDIASLPTPIDIAVTTIPAQHVYDSVKSCAEHGVQYNLIITSGFSEIGNSAEEKKIVQCARDNGMRIVGPNIFGLFSAQVSMDATFGPGGILPGSVAIITQSGALGLAMIGKTKVENIGLSSIVSVGNKCDLDEADLLDYLTHHEKTEVVLMYIEGIRDGEKFIQAVKKATRTKPVIVIKSGRSARGAVAAASHTGSLAGADEVVDAILRQCGVMRAESIQEAFNWCKFLAQAPPPSAENAVIITNGGGIGVMATDACERYGVELYDNAERLHTFFGPVTPSFGSTKNPVDITGGAAGDEYDAALGAVLEADDIGAGIALYCETATFLARDLEAVLEKNYQRFKAKGKPVLFAIVGGEDIEHAIVSVSKKNVPVFGDVYEAVSCLGKLYEYQHYLKNTTDLFEDADIPADTVSSIAAGAVRDGRYFLLAHEARSIMEAVGIATPKSYIARTLNEAISFSESIETPVVMKVVSRNIIHKSDAGGVALDLENTQEVMDAYQAIIRNCREYNPDAIIEGIEVAEMLSKDVETIIGARRDNTFGPVIMFGLGGVYVEVMRDVSFRALPLGRGEIMSMIKETRTYPLLLGVRGEDSKDMESVIDVIIKLGALVMKCPCIADIEINPLMVYEQGMGAKALDVRILLSKE